MICNLKLFVVRLQPSSDTFTYKINGLDIICKLSANSSIAKVLNSQASTADIDALESPEECR